MTPTKKQRGYGPSPNVLQVKKSMRTSGKHKRHHQQFNPGLYITKQLNQNDIVLIKQAFDFHDANKMGLLTPNDLKQALFHQNFYAKKQTIYDIIAEYDDEGLGGLTFEAFIRILESNPPQMESSSDLRKIFRKYDRQNKGYIIEKDIENVAKNLGQSLNEQQVRQLFKTLDKGKKGQLNYQDFCVLMHHPQSLQ